jgi:hypothetical protein
MAALTKSDITAYTNVMKEGYDSRDITDQMIDQNMMLSRIERGNQGIKHDPAGGLYAVVPQRYGRNMGIGSRAESGYVPGAQASRYARCLVYIKSHYGSARFTGQVLRLARKDPDAFAEVSAEEMDSLLMSCKRNLNRQYVSGYGKGVLAQVNGTASGQVLTVDIPDGDATKYLEKDMKVDIYDSTLASKLADSVQIDSVDATANTVTFIAGGDISGVTDDSYIILEDSIDYESMGLRGIIDDGTLVSTFQNLARASYPHLNAHIDSSTTVIDTVLLKWLIRQVEKEGYFPTAFITTFELRDKVAEVLEADKRYVDTMDLQGGYKTIAYRGVPFLCDIDAYPKNLMCVHEPLLFTYEATDGFEWMEEDGAIFDRVITSSGRMDEYECTLFRYSNLASKRPNANSLANALSES